MIWKDCKDFLKKDDQTRLLLERVADINTIAPAPEYIKLWKDVNYEVQVRKANRHGLTQNDLVECLVGLQKRPYYLVHIAREFGVKNIVEIGTAYGLQCYSFAKYIRDENVDGHVWTCDIEDRRNKKYSEEYSEEATFCLGTSAELGQLLREREKEVDLFYIDADHRSGAVLRDVENLRHLQTDNSLWIFDDFDLRFGCYSDIMQLSKKNGRFKFYRVGDAASGNPNHQMIIFGKL
jgi:predicted O-methyltransferase YrrM